MEINDCTNKTDEELVRMTLEDKESYLCLMKRYEDKLLRYILRISGLSREDAEDVLQDAFLKAYLNLNDFDLSLKFSSWIYRIVHNETISNFRKNKTHLLNQDFFYDEEKIKKIASESDLNKELDAKFLKENINKIFERMDLKYREVLILKFIEEKSYEEISDILKKPVGTVGTLVNRAKKQFKKIIDNKNII